MPKRKQLDITDHMIWKDKNIKPETKEIFAYLYSEGFDKTISNINIGRVQKEVKSINDYLIKACIEILFDIDIFKFANDKDKTIDEFLSLYNKKEG